MRALLVLLAMTLLPPPALGASLARRCRLECRDDVEACIAAGGRARKCRKQLRRQCRKTRLAACQTTTSTSSTTSTTLSGEETTTTTAPGGATTTTTIPPGVVNGCALDAAEDLTGQTGVTVAFPVDGLAYSPSCFRVSAGTEVTFTGFFAGHPLVGGTTSGGVDTPDPSSPFAPTTSSGTSRAFLLDTPGAYGFYCDFHFAAGMQGAVVVVP
jgi:plastocyanin